MNKINKSTKKYLLLIGISILNFFVLVFLHNIFYALGSVIDNVASERMIELLSTVSFLLAVFITPIIFLIGVIGVVVSVKKR